MKTMTKWLAVLALAVVALPLAGCQQDDSKAVMTDDKGQSQGGGVTPPSAPRSSADFQKQSAQNDPFKGNSGYKNAGK